MIVATPPHHRPGKWVQAGIVGIAFPKEVTEAPFRGRTLYLIPGKAADEKDTLGGLYPVVAFEHSGMSFEDGQRLISGFLNSVAWVRKAGIKTAAFAGGSRVHGLGGKDARADVDENFELNYLPDPADEKGRLALAFYREGLNLNSVAYQCLSFFKILNLVLPDGKSQIEWIDSNITRARQLDRIGTANLGKGNQFRSREGNGGQLFVRFQPVCGCTRQCQAAGGPRRSRRSASVDQ